MRYQGIEPSVGWLERTGLWLCVLAHLAIVGYAMGNFIGKWSATVTQILAWLALVGMATWCADRFWHQKLRLLRATWYRNEAMHAKADAITREQLVTWRIQMAEGSLLRPLWLGLPRGLFPLVVGVLLFRTFLWEPYWVVSESMEPTLRTGQRIWVNKFIYGIKWPGTKQVLAQRAIERGDVIVFDPPLGADVKAPIIKRVVGLPGDVLHFHEPGGVEGHFLSVNGHPLIERGNRNQRDVEHPRAVMTGYPQHPIIETPEGWRPWLPKRILNIPGCHAADDGVDVVCQVPSGSYFVLGDNRPKSADSRAWGWVSESKVIGRLDQL